MDREKETRRLVDKFYFEHGPCCAGCDWWRYHNSVVGECLKSGPVSSVDRVSMFGFDSFTLHIEAGHIMTQRDHVCGEFIDTHDWGPKNWRTGPCP